MKKIFLIGFLSCIICLFVLNCTLKRQDFATNSTQNTPLPPPPKDFFEENFPLKKVSSPYFINDLSYSKSENFLHHPFYYKFGINDCYVHKDIYPNILKLEELLKQYNVKAMMFDCFRPHEAQIYMWKLNPNPYYLANPYKNGSLHSKGLALDIGLADMNGKKLEFATTVDHFNKTSSHSYKCRPEEEYKCKNREFLKHLMEQSGLRSIKNEWWHYQKIGDTSNYPLIKVCDTPGANCLPEVQNLK